MDSDFRRALDAIQDADVFISRGVLTDLSGATPQEAATLIVTLDEISAERRQALYDQMVSFAESDFNVDYAAIFLASLAFSDPEIRRYAIKGLWEYPKPALADRLIEMLLNDPATSVRAAAASGLGRYVYDAECDELDKRRAQKLRTALEHVIANDQEDIEVRRRAIEAIAYINDDLVREIIDSAYRHPDLLMRVSAVFAMGRNAEKRWEALVLLELESEIAELRFEAARAAGEMQLRRAVPFLAEYVQGSDRMLQEVSVWSLGQIGGNLARKLLERLAKSRDEELADAASAALEECDFADLVFDMMVVEGEVDEDDLVEVDLADMALDDELEDDLDDGFDTDDEDWPDDVISLD